MILNIKNIPIYFEKSTYGRMNMKSQILLIECGRYTAIDQWKQEREPIFTSLVYVNSGWAKMRYGSEEHLLKKGYVYLSSRFSSVEMGESENFNHSYYKFQYTSPFRADTFLEINATQNGLGHLFEFGNSLIGSQPDRDFNMLSIVKFLETAFEYINSHYTLPLIKNEYILKAIDMIAINYSSISVKSLADALNLNTDYFIRLFKKEAGITPMQFIQIHRLSIAKEMLRKGLNVTEVSESCGYSSPTSFCYAYKKRFGYPPSDITKI